MERGKSVGKPNIIVGSEPAASGRRVLFTIQQQATPEHAISVGRFSVEAEENALEVIGQSALQAAADLIEQHRPEHAHRAALIRRLLDELQHCPHSPPETGT